MPHNRYVRQWFYDKASKAILDAVTLCSQSRLPNTMNVVSMFPETNPSMDSYRIGTILELVRDAAINLAEQNLRVRICVQASMGVGIFVGVPKQLNGVSKLLQLMDWQSGPGEVNEGMVGDYVNFGAIGADHVQNQVCDANGNVLHHQDDVFLLIAPQSMVGTDSSILPFLQEHVRAAGDRPVILINADLTDKISSAGQQSVRGRQDRLDFAARFTTIFHFQNIYVSGTSYFPILGAITKLHPDEPWVCHQRRDFAENGGEIYVPGTCVCGGGIVALDEKDMLPVDFDCGADSSFSSRFVLQFWRGRPNPREKPSWRRLNDEHTTTKGFMLMLQILMLLQRNGWEAPGRACQASPQTG